MISFFCPYLPAFALNSPLDWDTIERAFASIPPIELHQAWLPTPSPQFMPANARLGWREGSLFILATLQDRDIFNAASGPNQQTWLLGDTLELFLRSRQQEDYFELHVTPDNYYFQLHLPYAGAISTPGDWKRFQIQKPLFESHISVDAEQDKWRALLKVDLPVLVNRPVEAGEKWAFSVSRYDWTRGRKKPVISSTSAHQVPSFHRQDEWNELVLSG